MSLGGVLTLGLYLFTFTGESELYWEKKTINGWGVDTWNSGRSKQWYVIMDGGQRANCPVWVYDKLENQNGKKEVNWWCKYGSPTWKIEKAFVSKIEPVAPKE